MKKKLFVLFLMVSITVMILLSCSEDSNSSEPDQDQDTENPTVNISEPVDAAEFNEGAVIAIKANAADNKSVSKVEFIIDSQIANTDSVSPYEYNWNSTGKTGTHIIITKAYDPSGNSGSSEEISIVVKNQSDTTLPTVSIDSPVNNAEFFEEDAVSIKVSAADNISISKVELLIDGVVAGTDTTAPYEFDWSTTGKIGSHVINAKAYDPSNNIGVTSGITIIVKEKPDSTPPAVTITNPVTNDIFYEGDIVTIKASASDNTGVSKVDFLVDGDMIGTDSISPYEYIWDTTDKVTSHFITANAYDLSNNAGISEAIMVFVEEVPYIQVIYPNGLDFFHTGSKDTIRWNDNINENVKIELFKGGSFSSVIENSVISNGLYIWTLQNSLAEGTDYKIRITNIANPGLFDDSDSNFRIKFPPLPGEMILIEGGTFSMGDSFNEGTSSELPVHSITLSNFYISACEVRQSEWTEHMPPPNYWYGEGDDYPIYYTSWYKTILFCNLKSIAEGYTPCYSIKGSTDPANWGDLPGVVSPEWDAVVCNWSANGFRLPTEAEWEYVARGGKYSGDDYKYSGCLNEEDLTNYAWYDGNNNTGESHPVGTVVPNQLDVYDMSGNLYEWCWDFYSEVYFQYCIDNNITSNPTGPITGLPIRTLKGGYWENESWACRVSNRLGNYPNESYKHIGLRLVRKY